MLERVKQHQHEHNEKSMIPKGRREKTFKNKVQALSTKLGVKGHALRHNWAQTKFTEISKGIKPPLAGGPMYSSLSKAEQARWDKATRRVN